MKCKSCGREIIRIRTMGGIVACDAAPVTYWPAPDGTEPGAVLGLMMPNGQEVYGTLTGDLKDAEGVAYHPHTCHQRILVYRGRDNWSRPVYEEPGGGLLVDVDPRKDRGPDICTKQGNAFDGEPCDPVEADFLFFPCRDTW